MLATSIYGRHECTAHTHNIKFNLLVCWNVYDDDDGTLPGYAVYCQQMLSSMV